MDDREPVTIDSLTAVFDRLLKLVTREHTQDEYTLLGENDD